MAKSPHAVALGRRGGLVGGPARAKALGAKQRRAIASQGGIARTAGLSPGERAALASTAARARWALRARVRTAADAPLAVRRLLKTYRPASLKWTNSDDRYVVVREILLRGDDEATAWLHRVLARNQVRALIRQYGGAGVSEPDRQRLRAGLGLTTDDIPTRAYVGFKWQPRS
jgi:hypothetical protein